MFKKNLFDGDSYYALFAQVTYKWLISRKWVTYADIMADYMHLNSASELPCNVSNCDNYGELKKAFGDVKRLINEKSASESIEEHGNNRCKHFRYIGEDNDPLADLRNAKIVNDLKQYWRFCQDSAGFFPASWLEFFFKDCRDLLDINKKRQKGELFLSASLDRMLTNIELLPLMYQAIVNKQVLSICYQPFEEELRQLIFHPHFLKEFNGRWYLFGHADGFSPEYGYNIALDRIVGKPKEMQNLIYLSAPHNFYIDYFKDIIGVSHLPDAKVVEVRIKAHSLYIFRLMETKVIHHSQKTIVPYGQHNDGEYGVFSMELEINNEFVGRILQMGAGLEIVSPLEVRELLKCRVRELTKLYEKESI